MTTIPPLNESLLTLLRSVDTPTVCNAIEVAQGRRGFSAFTRALVCASAPESPALVGFARTAKISATEPPSEPIEAIKARRLDYYRHMATGALPAIAVVQDLDPSPVGAFWGEVNATIHKAFGLSGALTNGVMRDLGDLPDGFPILAGSVGPSHAFVHVREVATSATIFGLRVCDGDLLHADRHGALIIPPDVLPTLESAIDKLLETEKLILDTARSEGFDFAAFERAWKAFEASRT